MVAKHTYGNYIYGLISYNEDKVQEGQAKLLHGENFPSEISTLDKREKYRHFQNFTALNTRTKMNAAHFTLNFHNKDEPKLSKETLKEISLRYMSGLGLEGQPFLVYQHFDANHPHLHIVSTNINEEGKRLNIFRAVQQYSETTRKDIEKEFRIIAADGHKSLQHKSEIEIENPMYGKVPTRQTIENIIDNTLKHFSPTNLNELDTLLKTQGILMDRGTTGSEHQINDGLVFSLKGEDGTQKGVGIKASQLRNKPTSKRLQSRFNTNKLLKANAFREVAETVNAIYYQHLHIKENTLSKKMSANGLELIFKRDENGTVKSLAYLHKSSGALFNASEFRLDEQKFIAKITGHDLTYTEFGRLNRKLSKIYRAGHRATGEFESQYLQKTSTGVLVNGLLEHENQYPFETLSLVASQFLDYKRLQEKAIYLNDLSRFNKYAVPLIRYVKQLNGLNLNEKKAFLANFVLGVLDQKGSFTVYSQNCREMSLVQTGSFEPSSDTSQKGTNRLVGTFSYHEKKILRFLAERMHGHLNRPEEILSLRYKSKGLKGLIDAKSLNYLDSQVNRNYRDTFIRFVKENNGKIDMDAALEYGLLVEPLVQENGGWTYAVRAHRCARSSSISAGQELTEVFNRLGYDRNSYHQIMKRWNSNPGSLSLDHSLVNELHRMEVTGDHSGLVRLIERTAVFKPKLISTLKNTIGDVSELHKLNNISILQLRDAFVKLLIDQEDKTLLKSGSLEPSKGKRSTPPRMDIDSGYLSFFDDNEEELRRKKLLRKFYEEFER